MNYDSFSKADAATIPDCPGKLVALNDKHPMIPLAYYIGGLPAYPAWAVDGDAACLAGAEETVGG